MPLVVSKKGTNVILMASVAEKIDFRNSRALAMAACQRDTPSPIFSRYASMITMELSTIIPSVTMSAASVTVLSSMPNA